MADVSVVVVSVDSLDDVRRTLDELRGQQGVELEPVFVDNGSTDGTVELLRAQEDVRTIANGENRWLSPAWMQGVRATSAPNVLFLTPDASLAEPDAVATLLAALDADPGAALAAPRLVGPDGEELANGAFSFPSPRFVVASALGVVPPSRTRRAAPVAAAADEPRPVALVNGAAMLVRRDALARIGFLDERYRLYWEEIDLCRRLGDAGYRILLVPRATARHRGKGSPAAPGLRRDAYLYGERLYFRTHHGRLAAAAVGAARGLERLRARLARR